MQKTARSQQSDWPRLVSTGQLEILVLALAALPLLRPSAFPPSLTLVALVSLSLPFFIRYWRTGEFIRYCHVNLPVLALLFLFLPISLIVSPLPMAISWPRFTTLAWSISLFFVLANWPSDVASSRRGRTRLTLPTKLYLLLGVVIAVVGLLGMRSVDKLFYLPLPDLLMGGRFFGDGLATNEIAGSLTLFVPFAAAVALGGIQSDRWKVFLIATPLALLFLGVMVLSQSRTALVSTALALALMALLLLRPNWKWIAIGLVAFGVGLIIAGQTGLLDRFVFAGANSWDSVIGPRLMVWQQGGYALQDFALWGTGLGLFGTLSPRLYPLEPVAGAKILEDAHNLYLQSMLDFGVVGGLIFAGILVYGLYVLVRLVRRRRLRTMGRAWSVGLLAALVAHMLYSMTDAVAVGTLAGIPLWFLLGLTISRTRDTKPERPTVAIAIGVAVLALAGGLALVTYRTNEAARLTADALLRNANLTETANALSTAAEKRCELHWQEGLLYDAQGQADARDAAWVALLGCTDRYTHFMPNLIPDNVAVAQAAIARQPGSPVGYFWLAEMVTPTDPDSAIRWYQQGLKLAPEDGVRWAYLGRLLAETDPNAALEAYLQSCLNGDPGANGCLQAGRIAEEQGDTEDAIRYYRLSKFSGSLESADRLEKALAGQ